MGMKAEVEAKLRMEAEAEAEPRVEAEAEAEPRLPGRGGGVTVKYALADSKTEVDESTPWLASKGTQSLDAAPLQRP